MSNIKVASIILAFFHFFTVCSLDLNAPDFSGAKNSTNQVYTIRQASTSNSSSKDDESSGWNQNKSRWLVGAVIAVIAVGAIAVFQIISHHGGILGLNLLGRDDDSFIRPDKTAIDIGKTELSAGDEPLLIPVADPSTKALEIPMTASSDAEIMVTIVYTDGTEESFVVNAEQINTNADSYHFNDGLTIPFRHNMLSAKITVLSGSVSFSGDILASSAILNNKTPVLLRASSDDNDQFLNDSMRIDFDEKYPQVLALSLFNPDDENQAVIEVLFETGFGNITSQFITLETGQAKRAALQPPAGAFIKKAVITIIDGKVQISNLEASVQTHQAAFGADEMYTPVYDYFDPLSGQQILRFWPDYNKVDSSGKKDIGVKVDILYKKDEKDFGTIFHIPLNVPGAQKGPVFIYLPEGTHSYRIYYSDESLATGGGGTISFLNRHNSQMGTGGLNGNRIFINSDSKIMYELPIDPKDRSSVRDEYVSISNHSEDEPVVLTLIKYEPFYQAETKTVMPGDTLTFQVGDYSAISIECINENESAVVSIDAPNIEESQYEITNTYDLLAARLADQYKEGYPVPLSAERVGEAL